MFKLRLKYLHDRLRASLLREISTFSTAGFLLLEKNKLFVMSHHVMFLACFSNCDGISIMKEKECCTQICYKVIHIYIYNKTTNM